MADEWQTVKVDQLAAGDRVRFRGDEFEIARIDQNFLKIPTMVCLVEDTPQRWHAYPAQRVDDIDRLA